MQDVALAYSVYIKVVQLVVSDAFVRVLSEMRDYSASLPPLVVFTKLTSMKKCQTPDLSASRNI